MAKASVGTMERGVKKSAPPLRGNYGLWTVLIVAAITIIMLIGAVFWYCVHLLNSQSGIFNGVTIAGVDVSGLSRDDAVKRLEAQMDTVEDNLTFDVICGDYHYTVSPIDLGLTYDTGSAAAKAYNYGRNGGFFDNIRAVYNAKTVGYNVSFDYTYDTSTIDEIAEKIAQDVSYAPTETSYVIDEDSVTITFGTPGITVTPEQVSLLIQQRLADSSIGDIVIRTEPEKYETLDLNDVKAEADTEPTDAYLDTTDPNHPVVVPSKNGRSFDIDKAVEILSGKGSGENENVYVIPLDVVEPEVKTEDVHFYTYNDLIATATTKLNPGQVNRTDNIRLACSKINGTILLPGDEFSFNTIVGKRTYEAGFKDAAIYMAGEIADGVGGGICQVSSTLYMTAVYADLQITSRKNHRYTVTYTKLGQDATVSYDVHVDFKFKNDRDTAIKINIVQEDDYVKCEIYGELAEGEENKVTTMESKTISSTPFKTVYVVDESVPVNKQVLKNGGYTGYTVETYRVVTVDGKEVSRKLESTSKYTSLDKTYQINPLNAKTDADGNTIYVEYVGGGGGGGGTGGNGGGNTNPQPDNPTDVNPDPVNPGENPGGDEPGPEENPPWVNPSENPGGTEENPGTDVNPGTDTGTGTGENPGGSTEENPGTGTGENPGGTGDTPGTGTGDTPGSGDDNPGGDSGGSSGGDSDIEPDPDPFGGMDSGDGDGDDSGLAPDGDDGEG